MDKMCYRMRMLAVLMVSTCAAQTIFNPVQATFAPMTTHLFERAEGCPGGTFQCPISLGATFSDICCASGQSCALDSNSKPACCPSGAVCTGTAPTGIPGNAPSPAASYVPNTYFSFPYAPTTFDNRGDCSAAKRTCSKNYDICVSDLRDSNGLAVTINVPGGGGTTVNGASTALASTSATSVCSSLSLKACSSLDATSCDGFSPSSVSSRPQAHVGLAVFASLITAVIYNT